MQSRRTFLKGAGCLLALPSMEAFAASNYVPPLRTAFLFVPNGMSMPQWTPSTSGALELSPLLKPLAKVKSKLTVLTGLAQHHAEANGDGPGDHARSAAAWLTGVQPRKTAGADISVGVSADQLIANTQKGKTRFASLEIGCERSGVSGDCDSGYSCVYSSTIAWRGEHSPLAKETNPRAMFERLFGGVGGLETPQARSAREMSRRSILDFVLEDTHALMDRLGGRDKQKLDEYLTAVREIEERVQQASVNASSAPDLKTPPTGIPHDRGEHIRLMGDRMVLAFQADLTRVCTFMFANEGQNRAFTEVGVTDGHHDVSHHGVDPEKLRKKLLIDQFHLEQLAYILERLDSVKENGQSLLDSMALVYGAGISDGDRHNHDQLPILLAGKAGGRLKGGQHMVVTPRTPLNNLYMNLLDWNGGRMENFGDATGTLQGLF